jgi:hypothetical protein
MLHAEFLASFAISKPSAGHPKSVKSSNFFILRLLVRFMVDLLVDVFWRKSAQAVNSIFPRHFGFYRFYNLQIFTDCAIMMISSKIMMIDVTKTIMFFSLSLFAISTLTWSFSVLHSNRAFDNSFLKSAEIFCFLASAIFDFILVSGYSSFLQRCLVSSCCNLSRFQREFCNHCHKYLLCFLRCTVEKKHFFFSKLWNFWTGHPMWMSPFDEMLAIN